MSAPVTVVGVEDVPGVAGVAGAVGVADVVVTDGVTIGVTCAVGVAFPGTPGGGVTVGVVCAVCLGWADRVVFLFPVVVLLATVACERSNVPGASCTSSRPSLLVRSTVFAPGPLDKNVGERVTVSGFIVGASVLDGKATGRPSGGGLSGAGPNFGCTGACDTLS